ncbi:MAG: DUF11 domain-containing protein [Herpetosiphonaceae bacterium]|nr:DUF11 domain-containing protein [Herpetosiphonaceae bacterium]
MNGTAPGYHYVSFNVPCGWPASLPVYIDLFSPEMNSNTPLSDEISAPSTDDTYFELYNVGTIVTSPNIPAPGAAGSLGPQTVYAPSGAAPQWSRFGTLAAPVTCGPYVVRSAVQTNDQNAWRMRIGTDSDADPNNAPPANYDNPDGVAGTNDEITLGIAQTSYQHNETIAANQCITLYQYVDPGQATVAFHNFDMDSNQRVRYYAPSATLDPNANAGGVLGTVSGASVWNGGTGTVRGPGDVIVNPESGWWRIVTCVGNNNQYIQEGQNGVPTYYSQPPTPVMLLTKSDGRTTTFPGDTLNYTMAFTNISNATPNPGAAINVTLVDTLPANATYVAGSCAINPPYTGTCSEAGGVVTYNIIEAVNAGASGSVQASVTVNAGASGTVVNNVTLSYEDGLGNPFLPVNASDTDIIPALLISKSSNPPSGTTVESGDTIIYSVTITNTTLGAATNVNVSDAIPTGTTYVAASAMPAVSSGPSPLIWNIPTFNGGAVQIFTFAVTVDPNPATVSIQNVASVSADTIPPIPSNPTIHPFDPTAITLASFAATAEAAAVNVQWATLNEQNTWGFHLYRSTTALRADAVRITPSLILSDGRGSGASYSWRDTTVEAGHEYRYWLQEVDLNGAAHEYGPASASFSSALPSLYLPFVTR